jgi:anaerobic selenocysteine-containing dehydrogenase
VLPDTTYLERFDAISLLDRPISDADAVSDAIRQPRVRPDTQLAHDGGSARRARLPVGAA